MYRTILLVTCAIFFAGCGAPAGQSGNAAMKTPNDTNPKLKEKTVGKINLKPVRVLPILDILIPDGFSEMDDSLLATKYPGPDRPSMVYSNESGTVNVAINHTENAIQPNQLVQLHQQLDSSIRQSQPKAKWMFSGFQHYYGRKWTQLDFQSEAVDSKIHNIMIATSAKGRMLAISFNCTDELANEWQAAGRAIIESALVTE